MKRGNPRDSDKLMVEKHRAIPVIGVISSSRLRNAVISTFGGHVSKVAKAHIMRHRRESRPTLFANRYHHGVAIGQNSG
jgi:hypothetical protein